MGKRSIVGASGDADRIPKKGRYAPSSNKEDEQDLSMT